MAFLGFGNDNKEDQAVVAQLQILTTAVNGMEVTVTGLRNNINVLIGRINLLMKSEADVLAGIAKVQAESEAEGVDLQNLNRLEAQMINDFKAWVSSQPGVSSAVTTALDSLFTAVQTSHAAALQAVAAVQAADPGQPPVAPVNP